MPTRAALPTVTGPAVPAVHAGAPTGGTLVVGTVVGGPLGGWPGARPRPQRRVVVADDDGDQRLLVEIAVRRAGHDVVASAVDGTEALAAARTWLPDLLVLDVAMPGMSGLEVCAALRADPRTAGVRVLLVTAAAGPAAVRAGSAAGADGYVVKPFRVRDLSARVAALLVA
ncbi:response regulator transcription factor [uncultured Cellulomonas sp.]|uniref:response regulator transcription factor n=1 Tax=uncultured Cellulomonas sp. TaxID=189682 RepID=UPI002633052E|nr:response regulator [uncultured Cellulomonas sp.]